MMRRQQVAGFSSDTSAVSPIISTMLITVIMLVMIIAIISWGQPTISSIETGINHKATVEYFEQIDGQVETLINLGEGATVPVRITTPGAGVIVTGGTSTASSQTNSRISIDERATRMMVTASYANSSVYFTGLDDDSAVLAVDDISGLTSSSIHLNVTAHNGFGGSDHPSTWTRIIDKTELLINPDGVEISLDEIGNSPDYVVIDASEYDRNSGQIGARIAKSYVYDIGAIGVSLTSAKDDYRISAVNTMIMSDYPAKLHTVNPPMALLSPQGNSVVLYMVQLQSSGIAIGGPGIYDLNLTNANVEPEYQRAPQELNIYATGGLAPVIYNAYTDVLDAGLEHGASIDVDDSVGITYTFPDWSGSSAIFVRVNIDANLESAA